LTVFSVLTENTNCCSIGLETCRNSNKSVGQSRKRPGKV